MLSRLTLWHWHTQNDHLRSGSTDYNIDKWMTNISQTFIICRPIKYVQPNNTSKQSKGFYLNEFSCEGTHRNSSLFWLSHGDFDARFPWRCPFTLCARLKVPDAETCAVIAWENGPVRACICVPVYVRGHVCGRARVWEKPGLEQSRQWLRPRKAHFASTQFKILLF